ncbi:host attachment family protein [Sphingomonas sp. LHG3406-1]|uniref:host attachment family protein n=1 Tax=Sphingomonas sp. LHG3406-1 TaxID=2804617 RepID=UPI00261AB206|nr:host attachment family protein [Sphingomonas sp. LHG3406-1]
MPIPNNALVLVVDGRKMLFFRNQGDASQIDLRTEAHEERDDANHDGDLKTDGPGTSHSSVGPGRSSMEETDFKQQDEDNWVKEAAEKLRLRALRGNFEHLCIVAPPKALGVLRKALHKEVEKRVVCTINKEMSGRPIPDIEALIVSETKASEPADV